MDIEDYSISKLLSGFTQYMSAERRFSHATVEKYAENVRWFTRHFGDMNVGAVTLEHFIKLKALVGREHEPRIQSLVFALRCLLIYARDVLNVEVLDTKKITTPRRPRREVVYLSTEEINRFLEAITLENIWERHPRLTGFCFRALAEVLLASAMRIGEALALDRGDVQFENREAVIIGKGNKQRTVFFSERALEWLRRYLALRRDDNAALFATSTGRRLRVGAAECTFRRICARAGLSKRVTPHTLRHTAATRLLHNGCPLGFIKEVLGHERLETTCHFYLGVMDKADTKKAFNEYTRYWDLEGVASPDGMLPHGAEG